MKAFRKLLVANCLGLATLLFFCSQSAQFASEGSASIPSDSATSTTIEQPAGVGLLITSDKPDRAQAQFVVQYVLPEMSAAKANVLVGDVVVAVDDVSVDTLKNLDQLVAKIRGKAGTQVKLTILRDGKKSNVTLIRSLIPSQKPVVDVDYTREKAVWFYQREDIVPDTPERIVLFGSGGVRGFLRQKINQR